MSSLSSEKESGGHTACSDTHAVCVGRTIRKMQVETCARSRREEGYMGEAMFWDGFFFWSILS
jgi:hypothetical protein